MWKHNERLLKCSIEIDMTERQCSNYPISRLLYSEYIESNITAASCIKRLGYKNINKGLRILDSWLTKGEGSVDFLARLQSVSRISDLSINDAINDTKAIKLQRWQIESELRQQEERSNFKPYIFIKTELSRPTQICLAVYSKCGMKFIALPSDFEELPFKCTIQFVQSIVKVHFLNSQGRCTLFGKITGYRFVYSYDDCCLLDLNGEMLRIEHSHFQVPFKSSICVR